MDKMDKGDRVEQLLEGLPTRAWSEGNKKSLILHLIGGTAMVQMTTTATLCLHYALHSVSF